MSKISHPRLDSNESVFLARELESFDPTRYFELYAGLRARRFVPPIQGIAPYDRVYTYSMWGITGKADFYGQHAKDLPRVGVTRREYSRAIKPIGAAFGWTIDEIRAAAAKGIPLDDTTQIAATTAIERKIDTLLALGDEDSGFTGLLNDAGIATDNSVTAVGNWGTDPANWMASLNKLVGETRARLKLASQMPGGDSIPAFDRFQILLPTAEYAQVKQTPFSDQHPGSVLQVFLANNEEWVSGVAEWSLLDEIDSGDPRAVCYPLNPAALGAAIGREFTQEAPQPEGLSINVPCSASCGGTVIRYPVAFSYMKLAA
jgi:hypothetical protein